MTQTDYPTPRQEFINGARDTIPLILGAIPFGIIYGAIAINGGISPLATIGMSLFVFAGSAQFIAAGLIAQGVAPLLIVLTTFIVNLRHMLYAASLAPYMRDLSQRWLAPLGFWLTDETFAVVVRRYADKDDSPHKQWYHLGSSLAMYTNWQISTIVGMVAGSQLEGLADIGLDFALVVTFIGIVVPMLVTRPMLVCALVSAITALLTNHLENKAGLMIAAFAGILAGIVMETLLGAKDQPEAKTVEVAQ
ncbi:MAG: branched-chain amino acid ABC transporter permease [Anaerolineaceae bacterium]|nr:branched-chain amino acid ABC transporter permease [Anaerolineaceae bacterium]